jgi:predicted PurR-regulated permease PerM
MVDEEYLKKTVTAGILLVLIVLSFFLIKPILLSIFAGMILAFIFSPVYRYINTKIKSKDLCASLISLFLILIILVPSWFLVPIVINQSIKLYAASQAIDYITPLKNLFPSLFASPEFSAQIGDTIRLSVTKLTNYIMNFFANILTNIPTLLLQLLVVSFTFYYFLRDGDQFVEYLQSLMPFPKEIEKKIFNSTREITYSVIYGQVIIGVIQGIIMGIGLFAFGVPNSLLLTLFAMLAGVLPIIGPIFVWLPVAVYLLISGNTFSAVGILIIGIFASSLEHFARPMIVSRRTELHSAVVLAGMIGGLFVFGVLGLIIGPLILAYLLIVLEIYRNKKVPGLITQEKI